MFYWLSFSALETTVTEVCEVCNVGQVCVCGLAVVRYGAPSVVNTFKSALPWLDG